MLQLVKAVQFLVALWIFSIVVDLKCYSTKNARIICLWHLSVALMG